MNFEATFKNCREDLKIKFLDAKIRNNSGLQNEFLEFMKAERNVKSEVSPEKFMKLIESTRNHYKELFEEVDTENPDWENYHAPHTGYIDEWEAYQLASEQEIERIFAGFFDEAMDKIIAQKTDELVAMLTGLYEATQDCEIEDDHDTFGDVNEFLLDGHQNCMKKLVEKIKKSAISGKTADIAIESFFAYCDVEYPGNPHFPACFIPILSVLAERSDNPGKQKGMV